jgi:hypothetical protein
MDYWALAALVARAARKPPFRRPIATGGLGPSMTITKGRVNGYNIICRSHHGFEFLTARDVGKRHSGLVVNYRARTFSSFPTNAVCFSRVSVSRLI